jgi:all-trans-retinol 13,14-reductase
MSIGTPYKRFAMDDTYDAIVVGSGMGGLTAAVLLAKHGGQRVLVLERHYTAGGFTHTFRRPGFEWDVGVHYVGDVQQGAMLRRVFDHLTDGELDWADMGPVYDTFVIGNDRYPLPAGRDAYRSALHGWFPKERKAIDKYLSLLDRAVATSQLYFAEKTVPRPVAAVAGGMMRWPALRYARKTTLEVLRGLTRDPRLIAVLTGQWGDYGLPPAQSSFLMHAMVARHYLNGGAYPVGGSARIAETMVPIIEAAGGAVLISAEVERVLLEGDRAVGVRMADGAEVRAPKVISDAGIAVTFGKLVDPSVGARHGLRPSLPDVPPSPSHLCLYVGLDRTAQELGLGRSNVWRYPQEDYDAAVARFMDDADAPLPVVYLSFPSAKDPDFERRHPGKATIEAITIGPYAQFAQWEGSRWGRRGADYDEMKARASERLMKVLEDECPSIRGHVVHAELSTPLSTRHFAGHPHGEIYGLTHSPARFEARWLKPRTPIAGLYLTGADICTAGVAGAMFGGILAASSIMGGAVLQRVMRGATPSERKLAVADVG